MFGPFNLYFILAAVFIAGMIFAYILPIWFAIVLVVVVCFLIARFYFYC